MTGVAIGFADLSMRGLSNAGMLSDRMFSCRGNYGPIHDEVHLPELEVEGKLPAHLDGMYVRTGKYSLKQKANLQCKPNVQCCCVEFV